MANRDVLINEDTLYGIADAIRNKNNTSNTYKPSQMANAITGIPNNNTTVNSINITENGEYTAPSGTAYSPVSVNVPTTTIESLSITSNGTYTAPTGTAYSPINVEVANNQQYTCTIIAAGNSSYNNITYDSTTYYAVGSFTFTPGETARLRAMNSSWYGEIYIDGTRVASGMDSGATYNYTLPAHDIGVSFSSSGTTKVIFPTLSVTANGKYNVDNCYYVNVDVPSNFPSWSRTITITNNASSRILAFYIAESGNIEEQYLEDASQVIFPAQTGSSHYGAMFCMYLDYPRNDLDIYATSSSTTVLTGLQSSYLGIFVFSTTSTNLAITIDPAQ